MKYFLLLFFPSVLLAQEIPVVKYTTKDGLGHSIVYRIHEDKNGFLWFSTDNGLTRFDGEFFKNFTEADGLKSNFIFGLTENDSATMISTFGGGLQTTDGYTFNSKNNLASDIQFPIHAQQNKTDLWIVDRNLDLFKVNNQSSRKYNNFILYPQKKVSHVFEYNKNVFVCSYGLYMYNQQKDKLDLIPIQFNKPLGVLFVYYAIPIADDKILFSSDSIYIADLKTNKTKSVFGGAFYNSSHNILKLKNESFLIAESNGNLWHINKTFDQKKLILKGPVINDMFQDKKGGIWLATYGEGLWYLPNIQIELIKIPGLINPSLGMLGNGNIFAFGLGNKALSITFDKKSISPIANSLKGNKNIIFVYQLNNQDELLFGTPNVIFREKQNKIDSLFVKRTQSCFYKDLKNQYWVGMRMGLAQIHQDFKSFTFIPQFEKYIVRSISENFNQELLVGTHKGLFKYAAQDTIEIKLVENASSKTINDILRVDSRKEIWIATNYGLYTIDSVNVIKNIFPQIRINKLKKDNDNNIWVATTKGLLLIKNKEIILLNDYFGIGNEISDLEYDTTSDRLYFLTTNQVASFQVSKWLQDFSTNPLSVKISEEKIDGLTVNPYKKTNVLPPDTKSIYIKFSSNMGIENNSISAWYRLNNDNWINVGQTRELSFFELPYGKFEIQLKLVDEINHVESETETLSFEIAKPFYLQVWFIVIGTILAIILISLCIIYIYKLIIRKKIKNLLKQQRTIELEQKVLRNMLNPHFLNNAINSIQLFVTRNDQRKTLGYLSKFARLMQVNLELLESSRISLDKELKNIELYLEFEKLRFEGRLQYTIQYPSDLNLTNWKVPSLVLQPFVENAIWHGILPKEEGGTVTIEVKEENKNLHISITDNGIGIEASKSFKQILPGKTSRGTSIINERFELLNQTKPGHSLLIYDRKHTDVHLSGTRVEIIIPD